MTIGKRIAALRSDLGITHGKLSKALNISKSSIALYEADKRSHDPEMLKKFADYFHVTIDYLLCYSDTRNNDLLSGTIEPGEHLTVPILSTIRSGEPLYAEVI